jgi:hypothetical protein
MPKPLSRITTVHVDYEEVLLGRDQKLSIERAYGSLIPQAAWPKIVMTTAVFAMFAPGELTAPMSRVRKKLARLTSAAKSLREDITPKPLNPNASLVEIQKKYSGKNNPNPVYLFELLLFRLDALIDTSMYVLEKIERRAEEGFHAIETLDKGTFWNIWINDLTAILDKHDLPTGVRKDYGKRKSDTPSPFVRLVFQIQKFFPTKLQRHMPSEKSASQTIYLEALSQAIYRARRGSPGRDQLSLIYIASACLGFDVLSRLEGRSNRVSRRPQKRAH